MKMISISPSWLRMRRSAAALVADCRGIAAIEFAVIVPIMLVMFFGTVEFSSGVAVSRKVTLIARTLSDLTSQSVSVADSDLTNFFTASGAILTPYSATPTTSKLSELYVDLAVPHNARVQWSRSATIDSAGVVTLAAGYTAGHIVTIPAAFAVPGSYLIYSEVNYIYTPTIGYVMKNAVTLSDTAFTRPRQSICVFYPTMPASATCPTS
jgi:Flp pilus assembly protein TadG